MWVRGLRHQVLGLGLGSQILVNITAAFHIDQQSIEENIYASRHFGRWYLKAKLTRDK